MPNLKTVIDCNVIISASLRSSNCAKLINQVALNNFNAVSIPILAEYLQVAKRKKFSKYQNLILSYIEAVCEVSSIIDINFFKINYCLNDKSDEIYLKTAMKFKADYLITGNIKDFPLP